MLKTITNKASGKPRTLGFFGSILGLLALLVTVLHFYLGPIVEPEPVESFIAEKAVSIKNAIEAKIKGEEYVAPKRQKSFDPDQLVDQAAMIAALTALSLGVFGLLSKEENLPSGLAIGLGGAAVVFSFSIAIASILVGAILIGAIVVSLGIDVGI